MLENRWQERERKALDRFNDRDRMDLIEELERRKDKMVPTNEVNSIKSNSNILEPVANVIVDAMDGLAILIKYFIKGEYK